MQNRYPAQFHAQYNILNACTYVISPTIACTFAASKVMQVVFGKNVLMIDFMPPVPPRVPVNFQVYK